jgi:hypothetical protein
MFIYMCVCVCGDGEDPWGLVPSFAVKRCNEVRMDPDAGAESGIVDFFPVGTSLLCTLSFVGASGMGFLSFFPLLTLLLLLLLPFPDRDEGIVMTRPFVARNVYSRHDQTGVFSRNRFDQLPIYTDNKQQL